MPSWYSLSWNYRLPVTVTNGSSTSALSYAQVSVALTGSAYTSFHAHANANGSDLVVTDSDGVTTLPFALEEIDSTNSVVYLLVKLSLAAGASKTIYVYYGNASATSLSSYAQAVGPTASATLNVDILTQAQVAGYNSNPALICLQNQSGANAARNGTLLAFHMRGGGENGGTNAHLGLLTCATGADPTQAANWSNSSLCTPASGSGFSPIMGGELADGTILVLYEYGTNAQLDAGKGQFFIGKSSDGGQTWTNLPSNAGTTPPANPLTLPAGVVYGTNAGLYWGRFVELSPGGDILAPWYGLLGSDTTASVRIMKLPRSTTPGLDPSLGSNWVDTGVTAMRDASQVQEFSDPTLCLTAPNHLICLARNDNPSSATGGGDLWVSRSTDGGATWSPVAALGMPALQAGSGITGNVTPNVTPLQSGNFLLSWGQRNNTATGVGGLGSYCALSTDGCASFFDRSFAGSCEVSQGGAYRTDFGWPSTAQLPGGNIVSLCYRGLTADATTNIVCSVFTEDWVANVSNVLDTCQSVSSPWTHVGANTTLDSTHTFAGGSTAIMASNNNSSPVLGTRPILTNTAKTVGNFAIAAWHYPTLINSASYIGHVVDDIAGAAARFGVYATGANTGVNTPHTAGDLQYWNGTTYVDLSEAVNLNQWNRVDLTRLTTTASTATGQILVDTNAAATVGQYATGAAPGQFQLSAATGASVNTTTWLGLLYSHQYTAALPTLSAGSEQSEPSPSSGKNTAILLVL
jgi:hypothetical protein